MTDRNFRRIIHNPRHIPSIHNYCDRWCERCPFTLRCSVYAMEAAVDKTKPPHNRADESLWPRLDSLLPLAEKLLTLHANHPGVGLAPNPKFKSHTRPVDAHPIGSAAKRYMEFTHAFLIQNAALLPTLPPAPDLPITPAEALAIITHFHMMIPVKLSRALHRNELDEELATNPNFANIPNDLDGSAKIVLIAIDRSLLAWTALTHHAPHFQDTALPAMLTLHRLRRGIEKHFPNARPFQRPGFDTVRFPKK
jgi:hypothetical protein